MNIQAFNTTLLKGLRGQPKSMGIFCSALPVTPRGYRERIEYNNDLKCLYDLLSTIILALFKHGQTGVSQGHSSVPPEVYDSGIVPGISHSMPMAPSRPYWGFPPGKRRSPYEIWSC